jgi:ABC-2 type transport system ATP-binding protein
MAAVAEDGTTVLLSSHLLADLERVCDYLVILKAGRLQLLGEVEALLAEHKVLVGVDSVVRASHTPRQSTLHVRTRSPIEDPGWTVHDVTLEDLVLAYLAEDADDSAPGGTYLDRKVS